MNVILSGSTDPNRFKFIYGFLAQVVLFFIIRNSALPLYGHFDLMVLSFDVKLGSHQ